MPDPYSTEHAELIETAESLIRELLASRDGVQGGKVLYAQHLEYAERAQALAEVLRSVLFLTELNRYEAAFALLRGALEHQIFDQLLMLGRLHMVVITGISAADWSMWEQERRAGAAWTKHISTWDYNSGNPRLTYSGFRNEKNPDEVLSLYYFLREQYDPFQGRAAEQHLFNPTFSAIKDHKQWAEQSQRVWGTYLKWDNLVANLRLNRLITPTNAFRLSVHYRFLSAFVHPFINHTRLLHGNNSDRNRYDHYSSELVLLYCVIIGATEMRTLLKALAMPPKQAIANRGAINRVISNANKISAHMWFPGQSPHDFDRIAEANNRNVPGRRALPPLTERTPPERIRPGTIRYYRNPLERLVALHRSQNELTGWPYISPWNRQDACFR